MKDPLWVHGTCDRIMLALQKWVMAYHNGRVSATGKYLTKPGEAGPQPKEIEVPTRHAVDVPWLLSDLEHLTKILEAKVPDWPVTKDFRINLPRWKNGRLVSGGGRIVTMDLYFTNLIEIYRMMEALRDGKLKEGKQHDLSTIDLSSFTDEDHSGS